MRVGRLWFGVFSDDGGAGGGSGSGDGGSGGGAGDLISRAEAKKAFEARDKAKAELKTLLDSGRVVTEEQLARFRELEDTAAKAEEDRKKKAGEWDALRTQMTDKHAKELAEKDAAVARERDRRIKRTIDAAFGGLTSGTQDYFSGNEGSKTVWDVWTAQHTLGQFVSVVDTEDGGEQVVVKDPKGQTLLGADGNPAPFAEAIGELIKQLPNRDRILRGSGKTGSGSSGGSTGHSQPVDLRNLTPARLKDPKVIEALKAARPASGITMGAAFQK